MCGWENNIKVGAKETWCWCVDRIYLTHFGLKYRKNFVNMIMNSGVRLKEVCLLVWGARDFISAS
jgi:hypothetical protein